MKYIVIYEALYYVKRQGIVDKDRQGDANHVMFRANVAYITCISH